MYPRKIGVIIVSATVLIFAVVIAYAYLTSESRSAVIETLQKCDTTNVESIAILPQNTDYSGNLVLKPYVITDKKTIEELLRELRVFEEKWDPRNEPSYWDGYLKINFTESTKASVKNKKYILLQIYDYKENGVFIQMTNIMGYHTYWRPELKPILERLTNFQKPLGRHRGQ